jgi:hypothetical protein
MAMPVANAVALKVWFAMLLFPPESIFDQENDPRVP